MTEISKGYKIALLLIAGTALVYAALTFYKSIYGMLGFPYYDPVSTRSVGVTLLCLGIFNILAVMRAEGENLRLYLEFVIIWMMISIITNTVSLFNPQLVSSPNFMADFSITMAIIINNTVLALYFYLKEIK
ncbi:MAG: hypothetical protein HWN65_03230 [Candidatus Helarchaeota archaeon]|nr:hypothetical protein [Candidatus Helarchaeota archaeon]